MNKNRDYLLVLSSQFVSALGDLIFLAILTGQLGILRQTDAISKDEFATKNALITSVMFLAYIVFAPLAGYLNDRYPKSRWLLGGNFLKLSGVLLASCRIWFGPNMEIAGYFILGIGACIYSPAKYGILPELLPKARLVKANGTMELLTLLAILIGPLTGATMVDKLPVSTCYITLIAIFLTSTSISFFIRKTPSQPSLQWKRSVKEFWICFIDLFTAKRLRNILFGTMIFWIIGAIYKINFLPWGMDVLGYKTNTQVSYLGLGLGLGIILGSVLAGVLYKTGEVHHTRRYGWGLALLTGLLALLRGHLEVYIILGFVGVMAGLFLIPLNAALQAETHQDSLGKTIATQNFGENIAMICGGGFVYLLNSHAKFFTDLIPLPLPSLILMSLALFVAISVSALKLVKRVDV